MTKNEAKLRGYTQFIFSTYDKEENIKATVTYQSFVRDKVDFVIVQKGDSINLMRKKRDYHQRQGGLDKELINQGGSS